jgi:hypothetical protein
MIRFDYLETNKDKFREQFLSAKPFGQIGIDNFCDNEKALQLYQGVPNIETKSADYIFATEKYEKSKFWLLGGVFQELYDDLISARFQNWLGYVSNEQVFVDKEFYGGGIHQGKKGSFLDMHADFNYHPLHDTWFRNLNLLLYLNKDWKKEYGGELKLEDGRTGEKAEIEIPFNRLVIMLCRGYTLHGYDPIRFPDGVYRTSIAAYAYSFHQKPMESSRTTVWKVKQDASFMKKLASKIWIPAVKLKSRFTKSKTADH